ncbi:restriction endonuclease subunit S [Roseburia sp. AF20-18LB]|uniref:restriction endonuclease subunit S n=1 Tax=Roseburia sp. AF20-18LB TaxID=2293129 RepID=UPI000E46F675|nr:restriction endonuclease subunit S [Roseburia sp. AF20-18LB]RGG51694.1 restriction endonuclease subunit S [Roseburia sp. AF20-18LB]
MAKYKLGDVCEIVSGSTPKTNIEEYWDGDIKWITPAEINDDTYIITDSIRKITDLGAKKTGLSLFPEGTVILSSRAPIGKVAIAGCAMCCNQGFKNLICSDKILNKYLYWFLKGNTPYLNSLGRGATFREISKSIVAQIEINVPDIVYQKEVVDILEKISEVITRRKRELFALDNLIKARFVEMFGNLKITTTVARYIAELRGGKSLAGNEKCKNKVLKTGAATFGWFDPEQYKYLPTDYEPLAEHKVEAGDVIISRMNTPELVGACSYVFEAPEDMYYPDRLWKVIAKADTNPIFLWQLLWDREIRRQIKEKSGGTSGTMHNISKSKLLEIKCIDAPIELQNQFADFVKQVDKSKVAVQKALDETQMLFDSLMQKYFM